MNRRSNACSIINCRGYGKLHRLPNPKCERKFYDLWLEILQNNVQPKMLEGANLYDKIKVCDEHFVKEFFVPGTQRGLRKDCFPTLALPNGPSTDVTRFLDEAIPGHNYGKKNDGQPSDTSNLPNISVLTYEHNYSARVAEPSSTITESPSNATSEHNYSTKAVDKSSTSSDLLEKCIRLTTEAFEDIPSINIPIENGGGSQAPQSQSVGTNSLQGTLIQIGNPKKPRDLILASLNVTRQTQLTPQCRELYHKLINCRKKLAAVTKKCQTHKQKVDALNKYIKTERFNEIINHVNEPTYNFVMQQIRSQKLHSKARRFMLNEKILALAFYNASKKGYRFLSQIFALPSQRTISNLLNKITFDVGINPKIFYSLKSSVDNFKPSEKCCILLFGEVALSSKLFYNQKKDRFEGLEDFGSDMRSCELADCAVVFMVKGVFQQWKQPIAYCIISSGPTKTVHLKDMIKVVITNLQNIGLNVVATVCTQSSTNRSVINDLLRESDPLVSDTCFSINGRQIVSLYDVPHLFKGIRNNLLTKDLYFIQNGSLKVASWKNIEAFYYFDASCQERMCPKLTYSHVIASKMDKTKVSYCTQVFSHQVGSLMKHLAIWGVTERLPAAAVGTADFILFMDKLFDSLNAKNFTKNNALPTKPLKCGLTKSSGHEEFWNYTMEVLDSFHLYCPIKKCFVEASPSINCIQQTLKGLIYLRNALLTKRNRSSLLTGIFNLDCLEDFFSEIRSFGKRNVKPSASHFMSYFKTLVVSKFMTRLSPAINYEEGMKCDAFGELKSFIADEYENAEHTESSNVIIVGNIIFSGKSRVLQSTLNYVSRYVTKRSMSKFGDSCEICKDLLTIPYGKLGTYLCFTIKRIISKLLFLLPRFCNQPNVSEAIKSVILRNINLNSLKCNEHPELPNFIYKTLFRCLAVLWCRNVNKIIKGADAKFIQFVKRFPRAPVDPIKMQAFKRYRRRMKKMKAAPN